VLRLGLRQLESQSAHPAPFRTRAVDHGPALVGNLDDTATLLAVAERDAFG
jgi:hypothetical protein